MKLVINIPENLKNIVNEYFERKITHIGVDNSIEIFRSIHNGTPLPKGQQEDGNDD